jgi:hypothetical protein
VSNKAAGFFGYDMNPVASSAQKRQNLSFVRVGRSWLPDGPRPRGSPPFAGDAPSDRIQAGSLCYIAFRRVERGSSVVVTRPLLKSPSFP